MISRSTRFVPIKALLISSLHLPAKVAKVLPRLCFTLALVFLLVFGSGVLILRYWVLPGIGQYRVDIIERISKATGMHLDAEVLEGDWHGLRPALEFRDVRLTSAKGGESGLALKSLHASLSWWALLVGELRFHEVVLEGPSLTLTRGGDGLIRFNGMPLNQQTDEPSGDLIPWLLRQPGLSVVEARVEWQDDLTEAPPLIVAGVNIRIEKSGTRHRIGVRTKPQPNLARSVDARGLLTITRPQDRWQVEGTIFVELEQAHLAEFRRHFPMPDVVRAATGNARAWIELDDKAPGKIKTIVADIDAVQVAAQWSGETAPMQLATLSGRTEYASQPGGFQVSSKALRLRTREGVTLAPMDFSVLLAQPEGAPAQGAISGHGVDLKVISALLHYFPVGREFREKVARLAPRGRLNDASVTWTGTREKPASYQIKAQFESLAIEEDKPLPGFSGLTGSIEGDEKGGRFTLDSPGMVLNLPAVMREAIKFDVAKANGTWSQVTNSPVPATAAPVTATATAAATTAAANPATALVLTLSSLKLENPDLAGELTGTYRTGGKGPGIADLKARIDRLDAGRLPVYLPNQIPFTRTWLEKSIPLGKVDEASIEVAGDLYDFPFKGGQGGRFIASARVREARLRFLETWPVIDNIDARFRMEGTAITVDAEKATIYQSRLGATRVEIDDTSAWVPMLKFKGSAIASAQDTARYLRESPLREGPGRVTQVLSFDGPGKLDLSLLIPMGKAFQDGKPAPLPKVSGSYTLNGVTVQPTVGQSANEISGILQFTERSITSRDLKGKAFGFPLVVNISSSDETGVVTDLSGRADIAVVNDYLPFKLPLQVKGVTNWNGKITAFDGKVGMAFSSGLVGVASTLPMPLAKRETDPLDLAVNLTGVGTNEERIRFALSNVLSGVVARRFDSDSGTSRLGGGIISIGEPITEKAIPEGLWLTGKAKQLDMDQWRTALSEPAASTVATTAPTAVATATAWSGFDLSADRFVVYGRELAEANLKGRKSGEDWRVTIASKEVSGDATWRPAAAKGRGLVRARLSNLSLAREAAKSAAGTTPAEASVAAKQVADIEYPALDITADNFTFHGYTLGKLTLRADHVEKDWRIDELRIEADGALLEASGRWLREGGSRSEFQGKLDARNLNGLLRIFGQADSIRRGTGHAEATLSWPGSPIDFSFTRLSGDLKVDARRGEFAKIEPGAGRLLGLVSLQSLPRRLTLDFRDLFSDGFAFDRMGGTFKVEQGVMRTSDYEIAGPSAFVTMQGEISLPAETQNLKVTVVPSLGEGVSIITTLLGGPIVGLTTLLAQKLLQDPVGRAFGYQYNVTGKWDNPDMVRVGGPNSQPASPATATPSTTPPKP